MRALDGGKRDSNRRRADNRFYNIAQVTKEQEIRELAGALCHFHFKQRRGLPSVLAVPFFVVETGIIFPS